LNYTAFGLRIESSRPIPGLDANLPQGDGRIDLRVNWGGALTDRLDRGFSSEPPFFTSTMKTAAGEPALRIWRAEGSGHLLVRYTEGVEFLVDRSGESVWVNWSEVSTFEDAASFFLGPVMGLLLRFRGITCIHASAIELGGRAVLFAGEEGAGKSTTAAALSRRAHRVISDDIAALDESSEGLQVIPAFPYLSLWPDSVAVVYGERKKLPEFSRNFEKRRLELAREGLGFQSAKLPLGAVFFLEGVESTTGAPLIEPLDAKESLVSLIVHSYANSLIGAEMRAREFRTLGRLIASVPIRRLRRAPERGGLERICQAIEKECQDMKSQG